MKNSKNFKEKVEKNKRWREEMNFFGDYSVIFSHLLYPLPKYPNTLCLFSLKKKKNTVNLSILLGQSASN